MGDRTVLGAALVAAFISFKATIPMAKWESNAFTGQNVTEKRKCYDHVTILLQFGTGLAS